MSKTSSMRNPTRDEEADGRLFRRSGRVRSGRANAPLLVLVVSLALLAWLVWTAFRMIGTSPEQSLLHVSIGIVVALGLGWIGWRDRSDSDQGTESTALGSARRTPRSTTRSKFKPPTIPEPDDPDDTDAVVKQMVAQGRYSLLLRRKIASTLESFQFQAAATRLSIEMAGVPAGEIVLGPFDGPIDDVQLAEELPKVGGEIATVDSFYLDRYPVTNRRYYHFLSAGGYEEKGLWDESIWPAVLEFVDRTGRPGPALWEDGHYAAEEENHPVVGISWYEAVAYCRWAGKRLPSTAEWVKAGAWPVAVSSTSRVQRRYPWGDTMDQHRANLWGFGPGELVAVDEFPDGTGVAGIHQLIGNAWEWTQSDFDGHWTDGELVLDVPLKSIHGGAFNTYFESQATVQFASGEPALSRGRNISFRCAVSQRGLAEVDLVDEAGEEANFDESSRDPSINREQPEEISA